MAARVWMVAMVVVALVVADDLEEFDRMMAEPRDREGWVDPLDMGLEEQGAGGCALLLGQCREALAVLGKERNGSGVSTTTTPAPPVTTPPPTTSTDVFLKRHVSHLVSRLQLSSYPVHLKLELQLSGDEAEVLSGFVSGAQGVHAVDVVEVLAAMVRSTENYERSPLLQTLKEQLSSLRDPLLTLALLLCLLYTLATAARRLSPWRVALAVLACCLAWHWTHMYRAAWAAKHATLIQSGSVPPECRPQEMTWLQTLQSGARGLYSSVDRCQEYHKAIMVDPVYEVNPLTALVDLATKLLLHPLSSLGTEVGQMFAGLLSSVPLVWKVPVLLVFVLLLMFLLVLAFGYRVRLPLWLGELGPAGPGATGLATEIRQLKQLLADSQAAAIDRRDPRALRRLGSSVQELDTVDWAGEEEEEMEVRRRRCSLDTVHRTSSLPVTPSRGQARPVLKAARRMQRVEVEQVEVVAQVEKVAQVEQVEQVEQAAGSNEVPVDLTVARVERIEVVERLAADAETEEELAKDEPETPRKSLVVAGDAASPTTTRFQWQEDGVEEVGLVSEEDGEGVKVEVVARSTFLEQVEGVFDRQPTQ